MMALTWAFLSIFQSSFMLVLVLLSVAFYSLLERKIMGLGQSRKGPSKVSFLGFFQPIADAMKLLFKTEFMPSFVVKMLYYFSPIFMFGLSLFFWFWYPNSSGYNMSIYSLLFILMAYSLTVYGLILSGWFSNSKYALIGSGRALAQSISYEIGLSSFVIILCILGCSFCLESFQTWKNSLFHLSFFYPVLVLLVLVFFAELSRTPFDLPEGESELVSGYSIEYGGLSYTLIFLSENLAILWASIFMSCLFSSLLFLIFIPLSTVVRCSLPRMRFDKVMGLFWVSILPIKMVILSLYLSVW